MDCTTVQNFLNSYVDVELSSNKMDEIKSHLNICLDCKLEAESLGKLTTALNNLPKAPVSIYLTNKILKTFRMEKKEANIVNYYRTIFGYMNKLVYGIALAGFITGLLLGTSIFSLPNTPCSPYILVCADTGGIFR